MAEAARPHVTAGVTLCGRRLKDTASELSTSTRYEPSLLPRLLHTKNSDGSCSGLSSTAMPLYASRSLTGIDAMATTYVPFLRNVRRYGSRKLIDPSSVPVLASLS